MSVKKNKRYWLVVARDRDHAIEVLRGRGVLLGRVRVAALASETGDLVKPAIPITGFWMRNDITGRIEVLVEHNGKWVVVFGKTGPSPVARDDDQLIDHMIHAGGVQNLIDYGHVHGPIHAGPIRGRKTGKPDRREGDRRADKRRLADKAKARPAARKR